MDILKHLDSLKDLKLANAYADSVSRSIDLTGDPRVGIRATKDPGFGAATSLMICKGNLVEGSKELAGYLGAVDDRVREMEEDFSKASVRALTVQLVVMESLTLQLTNLAAMNLKQPQIAQSLFELAFKASNSCRKLILAIDTIKNPKKPTQFIKNYVDKQLNQLGGIHGGEMDSGTARATTADDADAQTVAQINGSQNPSWETSSQSEPTENREAIPVVCRNPANDRTSRSRGKRNSQSVG
ncbi:MULTISPECIES: hypothetical protein [Leptolyngbya]|uniref:hypothetical protein n=1 Tax=Leptolyngbya TaxID=47251 RepID=UPI001F551C35|nr:hypothetical protein [Leptolyngbya sp. FACHB-1624]